MDGKNVPMRSVEWQNESKDGEFVGANGYNVTLLNPDFKLFSLKAEDFKTIIYYMFLIGVYHDPAASLETYN